MLTFLKYQEEAAKTIVLHKNMQTHEGRLQHHMLSLCGKVGGVSEHIQTYLRGEMRLEELREHLGSGLGDVLFSLNLLGKEVGVDLDEIAYNHLIKLKVGDDGR